jgi:hypothetical protein
VRVTCERVTSVSSAVAAGDVIATSEAQQIRRVRRRAPSQIGHGSDARDLDAGPAEPVSR